MAADEELTTSAKTPVRRPLRLRLWFAGGFLLVFAGMLLLAHITAMHPSGQYAVRYPLWQYYAVGLPRLVDFSPHPLAPASGSNSALVENGLYHMLLSTVGGGAAAALGWCIGRFRRRKAAVRS